MRWGNSPPYETLDCAVSGYLCSSLSLALTSKEQQWVDAVKATYGQRAGKRVETWRRKMAELAPASEQEQLKEVNAFFNQLNFVNDIHLWGSKDYWATP